MMKGIRSVRLPYYYCAARFFVTRTRFSDAKHATDYEKVEFLIAKVIDLSGSRRVGHSAARPILRLIVANQRMGDSFGGKPAKTSTSVFQSAAPHGTIPHDEVIERVRIKIPNAHVFKLPPNPSSSGWRGADWRDKVWQGTLKVIQSVSKITRNAPKIFID